MIQYMTVSGGDTRTPTFSQRECLLFLCREYHRLMGLDTDERDQSIDGLIATVRSYGDLPYGWDTYNGLAASDQAIRFAVGLLEEVRKLPDIPLPQLSPIGSGVMLTWAVGFHSLYFEVDDESVFFVRDIAGNLVEDGEDATFSVARAVAVLKKLQSKNQSELLPCDP